LATTGEFRIFMGNEPFGTWSMTPITGKPSCTLALRFRWGAGAACPFLERVPRPIDSWPSTSVLNTECAPRAVVVRWMNGSSAQSELITTGSIASLVAALVHRCRESHSREAIRSACVSPVGSVSPRCKGNETDERAKTRRPRSRDRLPAVWVPALLYDQHRTTS
jgi:hypothetical protein